MKYKVGDKVRIKSFIQLLDIGSYNNVGKYLFFNAFKDENVVSGMNDSMLLFCGKIVTIKKISEIAQKNNKKYYTIVEEDEYNYCYDDWMFDDYEDRMRNLLNEL